MANKTIYGCRNKTTGVITFEGEACDSGNYVGCRVKSGIHAGQIAVTILEANCDDIYYGCREKATGKFKVIIPDDCCNQIPSECEWCVGTQPALIVVRPTSFSDVDCCSCGEVSAAFAGIAGALNNQSFVVPNSAGCGYSKQWSGSYGTEDSYVGLGCDPEDFWDTYDIDILQISADLLETGVSVVIRVEASESWSTYGNLFEGTIIYGGEDECGNTANSASNDLTGCCPVSEDAWQPCGSSGLVTVSI